MMKTPYDSIIAGHESTTHATFPEPFDRRTGLGGTDVAALVGVDPYKDAFAVWALKTGELPPKPASDEMLLGTMFQRGILDLYARRTKKKIRHVDETFRFPARDHLLYSPDAFVVGEERGVDAKKVAWDQMFAWGDTADDIPEHIQIQMHWYQAATGFPFWDVAVLGGDRDFRIYTIERDPVFEDFLIEKAEAFWFDHVVPKIPPPIGGSDESARWVRQKFPRNRTQLRPATAEEVELMMNYWTVRKNFDLVQEDRGRLETMLKAAVGEADGIDAPGMKFTWKRTKDSTTTDWKALSESLMKGIAQDEREALIGEFSAAKEGTRRIHWAAGGKDGRE